jgi:hypothetical protein
MLGRSQLVKPWAIVNAIIKMCEVVMMSNLLKYLSIVEVKQGHLHLVEDQRAGIKLQTLG